VSEPRVFILTAGRGDAMARLRAILEAVPRGMVGVQVREKQLDGGALIALVRDVLAIASTTGASVWVNDRADVAAIAGAHGVHLPERGLTVADARATSRQLAIGCSRHDAEGALAAARDGANLIQLGPIWPSPGKGAPLGVDALAVRRQIPSRLRLVAVGGIATQDQVRAARAAGADAVAVMRTAWDSDDPVASIASLVDAAA
jgi:thiamine-phosphate pyrophosphorylase